MRVVSLLPSATEIVGALGATPLLVGRSHECDHPADVASLPVLTSQRTAGAEPGEIDRPEPGEIDRQVREALDRGESLYRLDEETLRRLSPDVILTQDLCDVCTIDLATVRRVAAGLSPPPLVVSLDPDSVEAVLDDVLTVGRAVGFDDAARRLVVELRARLFSAAERVNPYDDGPSVAFLEWTDPLFVGGHWTPQLIERAGARHPLNPTRSAPDAGAAAGPQQAFAKAGKSRQVTPDELVRSAPDAIIICPCGMNLEQASECAHELAREPWWPELPAVRTGRIAIVDGSQMFNRPGPRLVDAFEWLVGWLNDRANLIPPGFPWEPLARPTP
jgi:ABC-type Fe3+-hydroxamate transport system substrate-binding protein